MIFDMRSNIMPEDTQLALRLWTALQKTSFLLRGQMRPVIARWDLTGPQWRVLRKLGEAGPEGLTAGQVCGHLGVTGGNMTGIMDKLEEAGLLQRLPHPVDRRALLLKLTEQGEALYQEIKPAYEARVAEVLSLLSDDEKLMMLELLERLGQITGSAPLFQGDMAQAAGS
jgi:MarR family 2-MHQ and catechol resistance regulon transcriptional repressor